MPTNILMPALSPTMTEGTLARWLKKEGEPIRAGDVIAEIETDKATMEVEAVDEGVLGKILVADGTAGVKVNDTIAVLLVDGEEAGATPAARGRRPRRRHLRLPPGARDTGRRRRQHRHRRGCHLPLRPAAAPGRAGHPSHRGKPAANGHDQLGRLKAAGSSPPPWPGAWPSRPASTCPP